jgi:glycosyltransferase involved in cell wall biosynthesis
MPLLSIVIPTRRRAHLLETALRSALAPSGFDDFEIVVSDNSVDACAEATTKRFDDPRVRYFNTGVDLDVYASWNAAMGHASGKYTFLFADDDAFFSDGLARIHAALVRYEMPEFLGLCAGWYSRPGFKRGPHNALKFEEGWTREGREAPDKLLREYFGFGRPSFSATYVMIDEAVRDRIRARGLPIFLPVFPDYALQGVALALAKSAAVMSEPTLIHGYAVESLGEAYCYPRKTLEWPAPAGEDKVFRHSPLGGYTFTNGRLETMLRVQEALPETAHLDIDGLSFLGLYGRELIIESTWRDVTADAEQYVRYVRTLVEPMRTQVMTALKDPLLQLCAMVEAKVWERIHVGPDEWMRGEEHAFDDIVSAAAKARELYAAKLERSQVLKDVLDRAAGGRGAAPAGGKGRAA